MANDMAGDENIYRYMLYIYGISVFNLMIKEDVNHHHDDDDICHDNYIIHRVYRIVLKVVQNVVHNTYCILTDVYQLSLHPY